MLFRNNLYNIIFAFYVIICLLFLIYYYSKEKFELTELATKVNNNESIFYLLWNGDFASTFRLAQMLIDEGKIVQPLYINFSIAECRGSLINCNIREKSGGGGKSISGNNYELEIMKKIISKLKNNYPQIVEQDLLLPIKYINIEDIEGDKTFNEYFAELLNANSFDKLIRDKQLAKKLYIIAKYSLYTDKYIDITLTSSEVYKAKTLIKFIKKNISKIEQERKSLFGASLTSINYQLPNKKKPNYFISKLRFPLINYTSTKMKKTFKDITQLSWSCNNPNSKTGKRCGLCNKCSILLKRD
jgi:hypothetical protein